MGKNTEIKHTDQSHRADLLLSYVIAGKIGKSHDHYNKMWVFNQHLFTWFLLVSFLLTTSSFWYLRYYQTNFSGNSKLSRSCMMTSRESVLISHVNVMTSFPSHTFGQDASLHGVSGSLWLSSSLEEKLSGLYHPVSSLNAEPSSPGWITVSLCPLGKCQRHCISKAKNIHTLLSFSFPHFQ